MGGGGVGGGGGGGGGRLEREIQRMDDAHKRELQDLSLSLLEQSNERARDSEVLPRARAPKLRAQALSRRSRNAPRWRRSPRARPACRPTRST